MKCILRWSLCYCLIALTVQPVFAQPTGLSEGDRVRVYAPVVKSDRIIGTVDSLSSSRIQVNDGDRVYSIQWILIQQLAVSKGKKRKPLKGFLTGASVIGITGGFIGAIAYRECTEEGFLACGFGPQSSGEAFRMGAILGAGTGGLIGLMWGISKKTDRWRKLPVDFSVNTASVRAVKLKTRPVISLRLNF